MGLDLELSAEMEKHMCKLLRCKTEKEAAAEVVWHFAREYFIREKYKEHENHIRQHGIQL